MEDKLQFALHKTTPSQAIKAAQEFKCKSCKHTGKNPWPLQDSNSAPLERKVIALPQMELLRKVLAITAPKEEVNSAAPVKSSTPAVKVLKATIEVKPQVVGVQKPVQESWVTVSYKKPTKGAKVINSSKVKPSVPVSTPYTSSVHQPNIKISHDTMAQVSSSYINITLSYIILY
jgi:hypothetical protein